MPTSISDAGPRLLATLADKARAEGLSLLRCGPASLPPSVAEGLSGYLAAGHQGTMGWLAENTAARSNPAALWPEARSALVFALSYGQGLDPLERLKQKSAGLISVYALGRDYHDVFKGKLKSLAQHFHRASGAGVKVFVDTAPVMEKPLAAQAGLGWQGKHTNLVSRQLGSWFFLGVILTTAELPWDEPEADHCGSCRACLDICPTRAFPAPHQLDARRCISYLTIEHKGIIDVAFRRAMGNRIYGCDDCLAVCPWNKFAAEAREAKLKARADLVAPPLADLLKLDDAGFRKLFSGSPVKRTGRNRFVRNCLVAAGNSSDSSLLGPVEQLLADAATEVRATAVWALKSLATPARFADWCSRLLPAETDEMVRAEWEMP